MFSFGKIFKAAVALLLVSLLAVPTSVLALTAPTKGQKAAASANLSIKWIEPWLEANESYLYIESIHGFHEGIGTIYVMLSDKTEKYFLIKDTGTILTPPIYDYTDYFSEGLCYVCIGSKKFFIDKTGKEIIDVSKYEYVQPFYSGFAVTRINYKFGLIDRDGYEVLPCEYDIIFNKKSGVIWVRRDGGWYCFGNEEEAIDLQNPPWQSLSRYDGVRLYGDERTDTLTVVQNGDKFGVVDERGKLVMPIKYDSAIACDYDIVAVLENEKWSYINLNSEKINKTEVFFYSVFSEDLAAVMDANGKIGYMNRDGEIVIPCEWDYVTDFTKGFAAVFQAEDLDNVTHFIIDKTGTKLAVDKAYEVEALGDALIGKHEPSDGLVKWFGAPQYVEALLDKDGNRLTEFSYSHFTEFEYDLTVAQDYETSLYGVLNRYGEEIVPCMFDSIEILNRGSCLVKVSDHGQNGRLGILSLPDDAARRNIPSSRPITVYVDGLELYFDAEPEILNGRTMVPVRGIAESLDSEVSWDSALKKVAITKNDVTNELVIGSDVAHVNGRPIVLDEAPFIKNSRALVPLRFISEALGYDVEWEPATKRITVTERSL